MAAAPRNWPANPQQWRELKQSFAYSPGKTYGGTRGDSAAINWVLAVLELGASITVTVFCYRFLSRMNAHSTESERSYKAAYYCSQFVFGLSILTIAILTLYILWVFADSK